MKIDKKSHELQNKRFKMDHFNIRFVFCTKKGYIV